jgi:hypothetical protein
MTTKTPADSIQCRAAFRLAASLAFTTALTACASGPNTGTAITHAKLVYVEDTTMFRSRLDETRLAQTGCTYESRDPAAMLALRPLLDADQFEDESIVRMIEPRYALYFEKEDGSKHSLLLDRQYSDSLRRHGTFDAKPITVEGNLASQLVQWAVHANISQSNPHCHIPILLESK